MTWRRRVAMGSEHASMTQLGMFIDTRARSIFSPSAPVRRRPGSTADPLRRVEPGQTLLHRQPGWPSGRNGPAAIVPRSPVARPLSGRARDDFSQPTQG